MAIISVFRNRLLKGGILPSLRGGLEGCILLPDISSLCRFVNRYRLEELEVIKASSNKDLPEIELIAKAGFSEWRGYLRVKQREESFFN